MNIYQHLFFLVPICFLFWFGTVRFNYTVGVKDKNCYPTLSGVCTGIALILAFTYYTINRELPVELYNWLGTL